MASSGLEDFEYQLRAQQDGAAGTATQAQATANSTYVDPNDGTVYEWDEKQRGWFPKIDDNFLATYHANYGIQTTEAAANGSGTSTTTKPGEFAVPTVPFKDIPASKAIIPPKSVDVPSEAVPSATGSKRDNTEQNESSDSKKAKTAKQTPSWFEMDEERNLNVYVSGLPQDVTLEEFTELMSKYGIIAEDDEGKPKVKLYRDINGEIKGDGLCCYLKPESITLALNILNESTIRNHTITVERAHFVQKGEYNPALKKKKPKKKKKVNKQDKLLDWKERRTFDGPIRKKCERIIVFKNVFDPKEFDEDPTIITDIRSDIQEECSKFGTVKKILLFDRHPEGIVSVAFKEFEAADMCLLKMNQRWYGGKQLDVSQWDGLTNFQVEESDQEREARLQKWEKFIKEDEDEEEEETKNKEPLTTAHSEPPAQD